PVNRGIPTESARNGEIPKIQTPLFGTMRHAALSDLFVQTFPRIHLYECIVLKVFPMSAEA
ncbi:hypothetical protein EI541_06325, partial [Xanthomonas citri pv. eucalyptorum]